MKPTFYDFKSLMRIFAPTYDEALESKVNLPPEVRITVEDGHYQLMRPSTNEFLCEPMTKAEFFVFLKEQGYQK